MNKNNVTGLLGLLVSTAVMAQPGQWEATFEIGVPQSSTTPPIIAIHMVHLHTGKVLVHTSFDQGGLDTNCFPAGVGRCYIWTPPSISDPSGFPGTFEAASNCHTFMFCGGHSSLADGSILSVGGMVGSPNLGSNHSDIFRPTAQPHWIAGANMLQGRWYPTATTLADGRVLACSGKNESGLYVGLPELYDPAADNWEPLPFPDGFSYYQDELYPYMFLLPDGNMVDAGPGIAYILLTSNWTWNHTNPLPSPSWPPDPPPPPGNGGSAVMYEPGKIMKCGGRLALEDSAVATTWVVNLDFTDPNNPNAGDPYNPPGWMLAGNMNFARLDHNLVVMPDGKVLALGGGTSHEFPTAVLNPEIFDPSSGTWTQQPAAAIPCAYHSTAMLLPDGRVVSASGDQTTAQIYRPPYITSGAPRPSIVSAPTYMQYGQQYAITYDIGPGAVDVSRACLIRLAAVTHGFDQDQRRVPLSIGPATPNQQIMVTAPANGNLAPPGYYMLFILNQYAANQFAPSVATYVQVGP